MLKIFCVLFVVAFCGIAQAQPLSIKKNVTEADYGLWEEIHPGAISNNGKWVSYIKKNSRGQIDLYIFNSKERTTSSFPNTRSFSFVGDSKLAYLIGDSILTIVDLTKGKPIFIKGIQRFNYVSGSDLLIAESGAIDGKKCLRLYSESGKLVDSLSDILDFKVSHDQTSMIYDNNSGKDHVISIVDLRSQKRDTILIDQLTGDRHMIWQKNCRGVAFFSSTGGGHELAAVYYDLKKRSLKTCTSATISSETAKFDISDRRGLHISDKGDRLFFAVKWQAPVSNVTDTSGVEVWRTWDKYTFTQSALSAQWGTAGVLAAWGIENHSLRVFSTDTFSEVQFSFNQEYAIIAPSSWRTDYVNFYEKIDYQLLSLESGERKVFLEKQSGNPNVLICSPVSRHIAYYRDWNWWIFDPVTDTRLNLTVNAPSNWVDAEDQTTYGMGTFGLAGWTSDGKGVLLYDEADLWYFSLDGLVKRRITNGKETDRIFRINEIEHIGFPILNFDGSGSIIFDLKNDIVLDAIGKDDKRSGYFLLKEGSILKPLIYIDAMVKNIHRGKNGTYSYTVEKFDQSPVLHSITENGENVEVAKTNLHQANYNWGKSELITYFDRMGHKVTGALFYPANFKAGEKYPMIVHVYQRLSQTLHEYCNPTLQNYTGFNITNLTLKGYFVLMPDISYQGYNPGTSAFECVEAAVQAALAKGVIDKAAVGLSGHSFGGFETGAILTRSKLFSAAIAGAGIYDFVNWYFNIDKWGVPEMWRYEDHQMRMKGGFFDNKELYLANSPLYHADQITTPLLSWTGKDDPTVPKDQSSFLFMALRRLKRDHVMLVYPGEEHNLFNPKYQSDLTRRCEEWFDYYLKHLSRPNWLKR
jgi:dipeptidyl aminopeptidase/acylaminoacyl peptidase